jgi:hypothetical protein
MSNHVIVKPYQILQVMLLPMLLMAKATTKSAP